MSAKNVATYGSAKAYRHLSAMAAALALAVAGAGFAPAAWAQPGQVAVTNPTEGSVIAVPVGHTTVIQTPMPIKTVKATDDKIAFSRVLSPTQVLVEARGLGTTNLLMWNDKDEVVWQARVTVNVDQTALRDELNRLFPGRGLEIRQAKDVIVVTGKLGRADEADQLHRFLAAYGVKYVDMTSVAGAQQVQIKVLVAEASRTALRSLGINAFVAGSSAFGGVTVGPDVGGAINPISIGAPAGAPVGSNNFGFLSPSNVGSAVTLFGGVPGADLQVFVSALAENQYMRVLAEPSLVAISGEEASFLAGGEFPIPVVQGAGAANSGTSVTIEYKEFGVRLKFRPTVLGDGTIRLQVAPEVSQLSTGPGSVQIQGFSIPALLSRRAETTLELGSGQTFAMAGLLNQTVEARNSRVPGLGDVPVLGALFRSIRYKTGDTELVVLVTASLVEPLNAAERLPVPGLLHVEPNDWELYAQGRIDGKLPPKLSASDAAWFRQMGLDRLKGPGAWDSYGQTEPTSRAASQTPAPAK